MTDRPLVINAEPLGYSSDAKARWRNAGYDYRDVSWGEVDSGAHGNAQGLIVRLSRRVDQPVLDRLPDLTFIVSATTGHDHLDLDAIGRRGIRLFTLREHEAFLDSIPSTAEHTWALMLALVRNVTHADQAVRAGHWDRDVHRGIELNGKTLGIVGMGRIGRKVARYAGAFGMRVVYVDPAVPCTEGAERLPDLESLAKAAHVMSLHVHLTPETRGLIGPRILAHLPRGAFLVNTSRGEVCDEVAITHALRSGRLAGVATDVLAGELDGIRGSSLWQAQQEGANVIITPHLGGCTVDAMHSCETFISEVAVDQLKPRPLALTPSNSLKP